MPTFVTNSPIASRTCDNGCDCQNPARKLYRSLNNAIAHIEWLNCIRDAAENVVREHHLQWPAYRMTQAIETLEIALANYADFTSNNEQSDISVPALSDLCEPRKD